jgi:hypothetical protein
MRTTLDSAGHWVPRTKPTCILHTWRPHRQRHFAFVLHLPQHQSSRNLHLQYLAKNQSTQRCQSLITPESDHPPVLEPCGPHKFASSKSDKCARGPAVRCLRAYYTSPILSFHPVEREKNPKHVYSVRVLWYSIMCGSAKTMHVCSYSTDRDRAESWRGRCQQLAGSTSAYARLLGLRTV